MSTAQTTRRKAFPILRTGKFQRGDREIEITREDLAQAVANFEADKAAGVEVPLDFDHGFAERGDSTASGWFAAMFLDGDELLGVVDWTERALELLRAGEFRGCSAEFARDHVTEDGTSRGFAVLSAALTNRPFLRDLRVAFSADRAAEASERLAEVRALIETGHFNADEVRFAIATERIAHERDLDYADAAAAAYREEFHR